jgi:hypothetical protein
MFRAERYLPSSDFGPVLFLAFFWLEASFGSDGMISVASVNTPSMMSADAFSNRRENFSSHRSISLNAIISSFHR